MSTDVIHLWRFGIVVRAGADCLHLLDRVASAQRANVLDLTQRNLCVVEATWVGCRNGVGVVHYSFVDRMLFDLELVNACNELLRSKTLLVKLIERLLVGELVRCDVVLEIVGRTTLV